MSESERKVRVESLQKRLCNFPAVDAQNAEELLRQVRNYLRIAVTEEILKNPPHELFQIVKLGKIRAKNEFLIEGGDKNDGRDPARACIRRADGSWFHFALIGRQGPQANKIELLGYHFEFCFPLEPVQFLRFDLNSPTGEATANIEKGLRSHFHPNSEDIQVPSAAFQPIELLDLFVYGLTPRAPEYRRT